MQQPSIAEGRKTAGPEARLDARLSPAVARRLRVLAALEGSSLSSVLSVLLDRHLPTDDELAKRMTAPEAVAS